MRHIVNQRLTTVALVAAALGIAACNSDRFLTETPSDFVPPSSFYGNAGDAITAVNASYATFIDLASPLSNSDYLGRNTFMLINYPTEVVTSRLSAGNERSLIGNYNTQFSSSHAYLETTWQAAYSGINRANTVIARVPPIQMDTTRRNQIVGEAKFLRAVHYYILAGLFGGVPLKLTETTGIEGTTLPRASAAETWAQIEKDCSEAAAVLPTSWPVTDFGRATKGAALTLLGKAYLQAAGTGADANGWQKADSVFRIVTGMGYTLDANYASLFDGTNEKSGEIIWSLQNIRAPGAGGYLSQWFAPITSPSIYAPGAQNQFQAERPFYDSYNANDKRKAGTWLTTFTNGTKTVTWAWTSGIQTASNYGSTGPVPRKFLDLGATDNGAEAPDYPFLRYADVLLGLAEAINERSGPTGEAYGLVNQVRTRAGITTGLTTGLTAAQFRDSLFLERRYEFAVEWSGIFDNRRNWPWAKRRVEQYMDSVSIANLNKSPFTSSVEKYGGALPRSAPVLEDKWRLYPIPAHACELNPLLVQNPGWDDGICIHSTTTP